MKIRLWNKRISKWSGYGNVPHELLSVVGSKTFWEDKEHLEINLYSSVDDDKGYLICDQDIVQLFGYDIDGITETSLIGKVIWNGNSFGFQNKLYLWSLEQAEYMFSTLPPKILGNRYENRESWDNI